jgi:Uma2 family endonuclease
MAAAPHPFISPQQYLEIEREAEFKSEYLSGQMFAMAGASREHVEIVANLLTELTLQLRKGPYRAVASDLRVCVSPTSYTYPDVVVYCGGKWARLPAGHAA